MSTVISLSSIQLTTWSWSQPANNVKSPRNTSPFKERSPAYHGQGYTSGKRKRDNKYIQRIPKAHCHQQSLYLSKHKTPVAKANNTLLINNYSRHLLYHEP